MGSFNDLVISHSMVKGRFQWKDGARQANDRLNDLRGRAYEIAACIKRNHETGKA